MSTKSTIRANGQRTRIAPLKKHTHFRFAIQEPLNDKTSYKIQYILKTQTYTDQDYNAHLNKNNETQKTKRIIKKLEELWKKN